MGYAKPMAVRSIPCFGWGRRLQTCGKSADNHDLPAEGEKDARISIGVRVAKDRLRLEVQLIEPRRFLWLCSIDVDVVEGFDLQERGGPFGPARIGSTRAVWLVT